MSENDRSFQITVPRQSRGLSRRGASQRCLIHDESQKLTNFKSAFTSEYCAKIVATDKLGSRPQVAQRVGDAETTKVAGNNRSFRPVAALKHAPHPIPDSIKVVSFLV
jgi:hypothetical protein